MVDNFTLLRDLYALGPGAVEEDLFLFGQIMARKKDGAKFVKSNNKIYKDLIFRTVDDFDEKKEEIVEICKTLGARAYINVNPKSFNRIAIDVAGVCLDYIRNGSTVAVRSAFATACGKYKTPNGYWVIDIDDNSIINDVVNMIPNDCFVKVPTVNGTHILTKGFDLRELRTAFPEVDIHKNNPTLLYY